MRTTFDHSFQAINRFNFYFNSDSDSNVKSFLNIILFPQLAYVVLLLINMERKRLFVFFNVSAAHRDKLH